MRERIRRIIQVSAAFLSLVAAAGCGSRQTDQQIQQQTAQATQEVKQDAQKAAANARVAAGEAEDKLNAVAAGVKQGWQNGQPPTVVDLNSATREQLAALPGISPAKARRIIAGRPYSSPGSRRQEPADSGTTRTHRQTGDGALSQIGFMPHPKS